jgi:hypothetical protein
MCRRATAQPRLGAAGEHRRQIVRLRARRAVPGPIDAAVHAVQRAGTDAAADLLRRDARPEQLRARDHTVLLAREPGDHGVHRVELGVHMTP